MAVYVIEAVGLGVVKIGHAKDVAERLDSLRTACPVELRVIRVFEGGPREERLLHRRFAAHRHRREWFFADAVLEEIKAVDLEVLETEDTWHEDPPLTPFGALARVARRAALGLR